MRGPGTARFASTTRCRSGAATSGASRPVSCATCTSGSTPMIRLVLVEGLLFLLPFLAFGILLLLQKRNVLDIEHWSKPVLWLTAAGLLLVLGSFLYEGLVAERPLGGFEPTHMENGQLVPGRFK